MRFVFAVSTKGAAVNDRGAPLTDLDFARVKLSKRMSVATPRKLPGIVFTDVSLSLSAIASPPMRKLTTGLRSTETPRAHTRTTSAMLRVQSQSRQTLKCLSISSLMYRRQDSIARLSKEVLHSHRVREETIPLLLLQIPLSSAFLCTYE